MLDIYKKYFVFSTKGKFREISTLYDLHKKVRGIALQRTDYEGNQELAESCMWQTERKGIIFMDASLTPYVLKKQWLRKFWTCGSYEEYEAIASYEIDKAIKDAKAS